MDERDYEAMNKHVNGNEVLADVSTSYVYEFLYHNGCCEGVAGTISIHKTLKGAEMAMEFHKSEKLKEWLQECEDFPPAASGSYDYDRSWGIRKTPIQP